MKNDYSELITTIAALVYRINIETEYAAWMSIEGHVSWIEVKISKSKDDYQTRIYDSEYRQYASSNLTPEEIQENLTEVITELRKYLPN